MKKKLFISVIYLFIFNLFSFSQEDSNIYLRGYQAKNYINYFDSLHNLKKEVIKDLNHSYSCYVIINIDKKGNLSNFEFIEIPEARLPELAKNYIKYLFSTTNGMWECEKIEMEKRTSNELLFSVSLLKSDQPIQERLKDLDKSIEFALKNLSKQKRLEGYNLTKERIISFSF